MAQSVQGCRQVGRKNHGYHSRFRGAYRETEGEKKIRERNRKWRSLVTHSAGESVLSAVGCAWQELDLDALDRFLASHADEVSDMLTAHGSTPEDAKARLDARKKKTVKTEPVADGGLQAAEPDSENSDW